jgi:nicotinate-nucleotide adenylyltransferase
MKIGILGGTFDPPHLGHLIIAEQAFAQLGLDKVWFAPVGQPPHKDQSKVTPVNHRLEMTRLAIQDNPHFELSRVDVDRPAPFYITTLFEMLVNRQPSFEWYLIAGGDSLAQLPNWYRPERLLELVKLAVAHRDTTQQDLSQLIKVLPGIDQRVIWLDSPLIDLASRDIQRRVRMKLPLRYMLPAEVICYIESTHLYQDN